VAAGFTTVVQDVVLGEDRTAAYVERVSAHRCAGSSGETAEAVPAGRQPARPV
jgi:hypothetical protein